MTPEQILALFDQQQRIDIEFPGTVKETLQKVVRFLRPPPQLSFVQYSRLDAENAGAVIDEQVAYFRQAGRPFTWKAYSHDSPSDLRERLIAHGFEPDDPGALMALDLQEAPAPLLSPVTADLRPITSREGLPVVAQVLHETYGGSFEGVVKRLGDHLEIPGYLSVYAAYAAGRPVSVGWIYFHPRSQFADLWGGATVPAYRNQGLYTALLAARLQEALQRGYRFLTIDAGDMSRPIVARHGFRLLAHSYACDWPLEKP